METHIERRRRWWVGFTVALFLLVPVDMVTTLLSVAEHGVAVEANPVVRYLLRQGLLELTVVNLLVVCVAIPAFHVAVETIENVTGDGGAALERGVEAWLGVLLVGGVLLVANNVATLL